MGLMNDKYNDFHVSVLYVTLHSGLSQSSAHLLLGNPTTITPLPCNPITDFKKGIKRDASLFPTLKDEKQWDNWKRDTTALANAQDVAEVLNKDYKPSTPEDTLLFDEKQKYMYSVFICTLLMDQGKAFVRKYETTHDAQKVYKDISTYALKSTS